MSAAAAALPLALALLTAYELAVVFTGVAVVTVREALVGLRAKAASEAHMLELASMNGLLLDRLRGLKVPYQYERSFRVAQGSLQDRKSVV